MVIIGTKHGRKFIARLLYSGRAIPVWILCGHSMDIQSCKQNYRAASLYSGHVIPVKLHGYCVVIVWTSNHINTIIVLPPCNG